MRRLTNGWGAALKYAFRVRFRRSPRDTLNAAVPALDLPSPGLDQPVRLRAWNKKSSIEKCPQLVLVGEGFVSEAQAAAVGERYTHVLMRTLAHLRVGADFGTRAAKSWLTKSGLAWLEQQGGERVLNDIHGLMVFPAEPWPRFASATVDAIRGVPQDRFERTFQRGLETATALSEREQVALEVFNASFFQSSADARFLPLVTAVEALMEPEPRTAGVLRHVESPIAATAAAESLPTEERESLLGSLQWLRQESISRTGKKLAEGRLGGRTYLDQPPGKFFLHCYSVRGRLVHGRRPFPTREEIDSLAAGLELFVGDLLSGPLVDVE